MKCRKCLGPTRVYESRKRENCVENVPSNAMYRRRECLDCKERFTTYEISDCDFDKIVINWIKRTGILQELYANE